ncbi:MAG: hypothetical protein ACHREM_32780 [Polyangiales bacterium]
MFDVYYDVLEHSLRDSPESWRIAFQHRYFGLPYDRPLDRLSAANLTTIGMYGADSVKSLLAGKHEQIHFDEWGDYVGRDAQTDVVADASKAITKHHTGLDLGRIDGNVRRRRDTISDLQARGIKVALYSTPLHRSYLARMDPARVARRDRAVARDTGVRFFNFESAPGYGDADFDDADHLASRASGRFTAALLRRFEGRDE